MPKIKTITIAAWEKEKKVALENRQKAFHLILFPPRLNKELLMLNFKYIHIFKKVVSFNFICLVYFSGEMILSWMQAWIWTKGWLCLSNIAQRKAHLQAHVILNIFNNGAVLKTKMQCKGCCSIWCSSMHFLSYRLESGC